MARGGDPIERVFVSVEADISKLLKDTAEGVDKVEDSLEDVDDAAQETTSRFQSLKDVALKAAKALVAAGAAMAAAFKASMDAVRGLRIETSFRIMAARVQQSSNEILTAMKTASQGVVEDTELMRLANQALLLGVAKTPEEFAKLTSSAITLGQAVGQDAVTSLEQLINAAGRRSTEVLDNLGISLAEVNAEMEKVAQQEFGVAVSQLDQAQKNAVFMRAALEVAAQKAEELGGLTRDLGTAMEQAVTGGKNLKQELGEIVNIMFNLLSSGEQNKSLMDRLTEGAREWQRIMISIQAIIGAIGLTFGQLITLEFTSLKELEEGFKKNFQALSAELNEQFKQILDPEQFAEDIATGLPSVSPLEPVVEATKEDAEEIEDTVTDLVDRLSTSMIDAVARRQERLEALEETHGQKLVDITTRYQERLADLNQSFEERRQEIIASAQEQLADLAEDTGQRRAELQEEFQEQQIRSREDFNREMRRLQARYEDSLSDAVKNRDARAIVDLQRQHKREVRERTEDFTTRQQREREDQQERLSELEENERERQREIQESLAKQLRDLQQNHQRQLAEAAQAHAKQIAQENASFARRQAELDRALAKRLQTIARELADEESINREGAQRILSALNETFGVGGDIDALMEDFASRRRQRMIVQVSFQPDTSSIPTRRNVPQQPGEPIEFQHGGAMIARRPTLAMFGEAGPELAAFTPMSQLRQGGGGERRLSIDLNLSGSAPPGIRSTDRDAIAGVLLEAMQESGMLT